MLLKKSPVLAAALMAAVVVAPGACQAGLFDCLCGPSTPAPTTYAPPYQAQYATYMPSCDPCNPCAPQVSYVPEVKYRWKYSRIERTQYMPVATADPCTGCPVTSYRPVTSKSLLPWLHREAYTTYRAVPVSGVTPVSYMMPSYQPAACNPCNPCATTCDPCGGTSMAAPSLGSSCPSCVSGTTVYPDSSTSDPGYSGQTFQSDASSEWSPADSSGQQRLKPEADPGATRSDSESTNRPTAMPRLEIPRLPGDKMASASRVRTVAYDEPVLFNGGGNLYQAATVVVPVRLVPVE